MKDEKFAEAAEALRQLDEMQIKIGEVEGKPCSDSELARRFLPFSATTLSRMRAGMYSGDVARVTRQIRFAVDEIEMRLDRLRRAAEADKSFVRTRLAKAAIAAITKARDGKGRSVVIILAPTGAGKTEIGRHLQSRGAIYVEGRQSWMASYKAFCADVCAAAGRPIRTTKYSERDAENEMLAALRARDGILYIDEANTLGRSTANAIKLIANQTGYTVALAAIPEMWDAFILGAENEVRQVVNRCQPILRHDRLSAADITPFLERTSLSKDDIQAALPLVLNAANEFGALKTISTLIEALAATEKPALEDVRKELGYHKSNIIAAGIRGATK